MPQQAILSDINGNLINAYAAIRDDWQIVYELLQIHGAKHCKDYYYKIRSVKYEDKFDMAAQFIYLNRTCWNGLYRVNKCGEFNVPIGTKDSVLLKTDDFLTISEILQGALLFEGDFEHGIDLSRDGDLLFVDPPYTVTHNNNGFLKYNENIFSWNDQVRLRDALVRAKARGVKIILTNADHESIRKIYEDEFQIRTMCRSSILASDRQARGRISELLVL
jgi:DNA adenine methylase